MESSNQTPSELLTLAEAAKVLRVKISTIRSWKLQKTFLAFRKIGAAFWFTATTFPGLSNRQKCQQVPGEHNLRSGAA